jgi:hypothetical protein
MPRAVILLASLASVLTGCFSNVAVREPKGEALPISKGHFPHEALDGVLQKFVNDQGRVDYKALKADRNDLERYLIALTKTSPHQEPDAFPTVNDKLAYWINAYNAYVLYAVIERPEMHSVNDDAKTFFYFTQYRLGNENWSLYKLENNVVRKEFKEPRVHFALNCASGGCPELPNEAFTPDKLEDQLSQEATKFCASDKKVRIKDPKTVEFSQIFEWYGDDFAESGGPIAFCKKWGRTDLPDGAQVTFIPYDWSLNAQPGKALFDP